MHTIDSKRICSAIAMVALMVFYGTAGTLVSAASPVSELWCYEDCDEETSCEEECENDGGGTITCGEYQGGAGNGWCDGNTCDNLCNIWRHPAFGCWLDNEMSDCGTFGDSAECGDNLCQTLEAGENCGSCPQDCGGNCPSPISCPNELCEAGESYRTCPQDCGGDPGENCGDWVCSGDESSESCPQDCDMPNERCELDDDCPIGYKCVPNGEPMGGQCVKSSTLWAYACDQDNECGHIGAGYVCRQVPGQSEKFCIYWYDVS